MACIVAVNELKSSIVCGRTKVNETIAGNMVVTGVQGSGLSRAMRIVVNDRKSFTVLGVADEIGRKALRK